MGNILIDAGFISALIAALSYFTVAYGKGRNIKFARFFFNAAVVLTVSSSVYLLYLILSHQFQYTYVWSYSSRDLPLGLLMSTFYAGQEGSFQLWAFFQAVLGVFLLSYLMKRDTENKDKFEPYVMGMYSVLLTFLLFVLIIKSPYTYIWDSFTKDVELGFIPPDGRGLNPLLQNFWMTIHPPMLFLGFAALAIPFCFAVSALIKNKYDTWLKLALPWTSFGGLVLGAGIMLGGYWAYGVLGWGGYWGWDPVENSSLVPWITTIAAMHTMLSQERTGRYKKTTLFLSIISFVLVLYSTFLTRSGILGDASVHSFAEPGQEVYIFLVVLLSLFALTGIGLILYRLKSLRPADEQQANLFSRESALFIGAVTLCAAALVIAVGTSWPIISKATVDTSFYNRMNLPIAIFIALINGFSLILKWKHSDEKAFLKNMYLPLGLTGAVTIALVMIGMNDITTGVLAAAAFFALFINAQTAYSIFIKNRVKAGAYIAHLGLMILFLGIVGSAKYSGEQNVSLPINQQKEVLGYKMTYKGAKPIPGDEEKYHFNVSIEKDGKRFLLQPVMFYSEYSEGIMKNPDIANLVTKDLYLSPMSLETGEDYKTEDIIELTKGKPVEFKGLTIKFIDFDRSKFEMPAEGMKMGHGNSLGAELEVNLDGKTEKIVAEQTFTEEGGKPVPVSLSSTDSYTFYLTDISVDENANIKLAVVGTPVHNHSEETLVLTASVKPLINLVWGGTVVMCLGFTLALINRFRMIRTKENGAKIKMNGRQAHINGDSKEKKTDRVITS